MMNFTERAVPGISANFLMKEAEARYFFAKKHLIKTGTILDMACGTGYGSQIVADKNNLYIGIDISNEALKFAQSHYGSENIFFIKNNVNKTLFKNKSFSTVIAFEMIEHLKSPKLFLSEVCRLLANSGVFIVSTPNSLVQSPDGELMSPYHTHEYNPRELDLLLKKYFKHVSIYGQVKHEKVKETLRKFTASQKTRQFFVDIDIFSIRKLIPKELKEKSWKHIGGLFGRQAQESITKKDFLFSKKNIKHSEYLIAICKK